ncbi:unnamed protein product, partial [Closterium sp. Naga37s-1]
MVSDAAKRKAAAKKAAQLNRSAQKVSAPSADTSAKPAEPPASASALAEVAAAAGGVESAGRGENGTAASVEAGSTAGLPVTRVVFPPSLTPKQRAALHDLADTHGWQHESRDMPGGSHRQLVLWWEGEASEGEGRTLHVGADDGRQQEQQQQQPIGAHQLGDALKQHLGWDVPADALGGNDRGGSGTEGMGTGGRGAGKGGAGAGGGKGGAGMGYGAAGMGRARGVAADVSDCSDVYEFVKRMRPLLDLEKVRRAFPPTRYTRLLRRLKSYCSNVHELVKRMDERPLLDLGRVSHTQGWTWRSDMLGRVAAAMVLGVQPPAALCPRDAEVALAEEAASTRSLASAQAKGRVLCHLRCTEATSGLMGKTLLTLVSNKTGKASSKGTTADAGPAGSGAGSGSRASGPVLPPHKFTPHDVVAIRANKAEGAQAAIAQGVVYRVREDAVVVAVDEVPDGEGLDAPVRIEKLANDVTFKRMRDTLGALSRTGDVGVSTVGRPGAALIPVLFGQSEPRLAKAPPPFTPFNRALDESQKAAVAKSLSSHHVALIHGPPGTGKTTTVVEVVVQEVKRGSKVLVCAASNIAVDNLVERLVPHKQVRAVRVGHPARLLPSILNSSLDALVQQSDNSALAKDVRKEMQQLSGKLLKTRIRRERGEIQRDLRRLGKEERQRQQRAVQDVLKDSNVVLTTLTGSLSRHLEPLTFDLVVIDEAAQALEVSCWAAVLKAPRCILSGDHLQLPPTVQCDEAQKRGLGVTLFERLHRLYGDRITSMLTVQYRMHQDIMCWASDELYQSLLSAHASVARHGLPDLPGVVSGPVTEARLVLVDTTGCDDVEEQREEEGESLRNEGEARVVVAHVRRLLEAGVDAGDIGIVTPYSAQVGLLKSFREDSRQLARVEISTVDGFQGREKEAIIISMVRSNDTGEAASLNLANISVLNQTDSRYLSIVSTESSNPEFTEDLPAELCWSSSIHGGSRISLNETRNSDQETLESRGKVAFRPGGVMVYGDGCKQCHVGQACSLYIAVQSPAHWIPASASASLQWDMMVTLRGPSLIHVRLTTLKAGSPGQSVILASYTPWDAGDYSMEFRVDGSNLNYTKDWNRLGQHVFAQIPVSVLQGSQPRDWLEQPQLDGANMDLSAVKSPCAHGIAGRWLAGSDATSQNGLTDLNTAIATTEKYRWAFFSCARASSLNDMLWGLWKAGVREVNVIGDSHMRGLIMHLWFMHTGTAHNMTLVKHGDISYTLNVTAPAPAGGVPAGGELVKQGIIRVNYNWLDGIYDNNVAGCS